MKLWKVPEDLCHQLDEKYPCNQAKLPRNCGNPMPKTPDLNHQYHCSRQHGHTGPHRFCVEIPTALYLWLDEDVVDEKAFQMYLRLL